MGGFCLWRMASSLVCAAPLTPRLPTYESAVTPPNIFADAEEPLLHRALFFIGALIGTGLLTAYAVIKSKRLADLLDALSDESLSPNQRLRAIFGSWRRSA